MRLNVKVYTNEEQVGSITLSAEGKFSIAPPDSYLLQNILKNPVFVPIGGKLEDVYAGKDPVLFMESLVSHYKSQGLRATEAEDLDGDDDEEDEEEEPDAALEISGGVPLKQAPPTHAQHAPRGGMNIGEHRYEGGERISDEHWQSATPQEQKQVADYWKKPDTHGPNYQLPEETRPKLEQHESAALLHYSYRGDRPLNGALRSNQELPEHVKATHEGLQSAFRKAPTLAKPVTVLRGMFKDAPDEDVQQFINSVSKAKEGGHTLHLGGYTSTTSAHQLPESFRGKVTLRIKANHGLDTTPHGHFSTEREMLLSHNSGFKPTGITRGANGEHIVDLEQVAPEPGESAPALPQRGALQRLKDWGKAQLSHRIGLSTDGEPEHCRFRDEDWDHWYIDTNS